LSPLLEQLAFLWQIDDSKKNEWMNFRLMMELAAIDQIIHMGDQADFSEMENIVKQIDSPDFTVEEKGALDAAFHKALAKAANNETFAEMMQAVVSSSMNAHHAIPDPAQIEELNKDHFQILAKLKAGDGSAAKEMMRLHFEHFQAYCSMDK